MKKTEYRRMAEREKTYWWHVGRLRIINTYLDLASKGKNDLKILNIGCGTGGTLPTLEKFGRVTNVDVSDDAIYFMKQNGYRVDKVEGIKLPYKDETFDMLCAFDVLEHIDEDVNAMKEWRRVLKRDGKVVLTVPAYQWLWSGHDVSLHHFRRHTTKTITDKASVAKLLVDKLSYAIVFSFPLVVGFRALHRLSGKQADSETSYINVPEWANTFFSKLLFGEAAGHKFIRYPFGTSVVAILRRR